MPLNELKIQSIYFLPEENFVGEVLIPSLKKANTLKIMMGFFSSASFKEIAGGLSEYLNNTESPIRLLISPYLSEEDQRALTEGISSPAELLESKLTALIGEASISESALVRHTLHCLAYLVSKNRLEVRVGFLPKSLFHTKVWIIQDTEFKIAAHGSSNMTGAGLTENYEQMAISKSWEGTGSIETINRLDSEFEKLWENKSKSVTTIELSTAVKEKLFKKYTPSKCPIPEDYVIAQKADRECDKQNNPIHPQVIRKSFAIPETLVYEEGKFNHQGKAVKAWLEADNRGLLEMCTGSGKTITALISAQKLHEELDSLLIVIAVPYKPLVVQWAKDAEWFGLEPHLLGEEYSKAKRLEVTDSLLRQLKYKASKVESIIITHDLLCDPDFQAILANTKVPLMLIADEAHNLGRQEFIQSPPEFFQYRLGLSATPIRQYDAVGTDILLNFFNGIVFSFTLKDAIGVCLTPYNYYVHPVELSVDEAEEWVDLTDKIRRAGWKAGDDKPSQYVENLLRKRRVILDQAIGKLALLDKLLTEHKKAGLHHTLIYATDKAPEQLLEVNRLLIKHETIFHQVTSEETSDPDKVRLILERFAEGEYKVLTAKRVLDEGVNIPQILTAYILASTTVERQWVQRRGRVLRICPEINKRLAHIHDFIVLPPKNEIFTDRDTKNLIRSELKRIFEFAELAKNAGEPTGPLNVVNQIYDTYYTGADVAECLLTESV